MLQLCSRMKFSPLHPLCYVYKLLELFNHIPAFIFSQVSIIKYIKNLKNLCFDSTRTLTHKCILLCNLSHAIQTLQLDSHL